LSDLTLVRDAGLGSGALDVAVAHALLQRVSRGEAPSTLRLHRSGPTVAFLVPDNERGLDLAVALTASGVSPAVKRAVGPVRGAHIVTGPVAPRSS